MPKGHTSIAEFVRQFERHCRLEGKSETSCRWYREILGKFLEWAGDCCLQEFTLLGRGIHPACDCLQKTAEHQSVKGISSPPVYPGQEVRVKLYPLDKD